MRICVQPDAATVLNALGWSCCLQLQQYPPAVTRYAALLQMISQRLAMSIRAWFVTVIGMQIDCTTIEVVRLTKHDVVLTPCPDLRRLTGDVRQADAAVWFLSMLFKACSAWD